MEVSTLLPGELPSGISVVKFSSPKCGPCRDLAPKFEALDFEGVNLYTINPQKPEAANWILDYSLKIMPTTIIFKDNEEVGRVVGSNIQDIQQKIEDSL